jgi:hypothetical protein
MVVGPQSRESPWAPLVPASLRPGLPDAAAHPFFATHNRFPTFAFLLFCTATLAFAPAIHAAQVPESVGEPTDHPICLRDVVSCSINPPGNSGSSGFIAAGNDTHCVVSRGVGGLAWGTGQLRSDRLLAAGLPGESSAESSALLPRPRPASKGGAWAGLTPTRARQSTITLCDPVWNRMLVIGASPSGGAPFGRDSLLAMSVSRTPPSERPGPAPQRMGSSRERPITPYDAVLGPPIMHLDHGVVQELRLSAIPAQ